MICPCHLREPALYSRSECRWPDFRGGRLLELCHQRRNISVKQDVIHPPECARINHFISFENVFLKRESRLWYLFFFVHNYYHYSSRRFNYSSSTPSIIAVKTRYCFFFKKQKQNWLNRRIQRFLYIALQYFKYLRMLQNNKSFSYKYIYILYIYILSVIHVHQQFDRLKRLYRFRSCDFSPLSPCLWWEFHV